MTTTSNSTDTTRSLTLAGCLIQDDQGRLLLLHRNTTTHTHWECSGGKRKHPGEPLAVTASREVLEELDVDILIKRNLGTRTFSEDGVELTFTWYLARIVGGAPRICEPHLHDAFDYFTPDQVKRMYDDLSSSMQTLVDELNANRISL